MTEAPVSFENSTSEPLPPLPIRVFAFTAPILALVNGIVIVSMGWSIAEMPQVGRAILVMVAIAYALGSALRRGKALVWFITVTLSFFALAANYVLWAILQELGRSGGSEVENLTQLHTSPYTPGTLVAILALGTLFWPVSLRHVFKNPKRVKGPPDRYSRTWEQR